jgi:sirohydrochlorin ferrochelatase
MTEGALGPPPAPALILVAHGSRDPRAAATVEALAARVRASRANVDVAVAYLEHAQPRLHEALGTAYERGHREAVVAPLLLTAAYHSDIDLPRQLAAAGVAVTPESPVAPAGHATASSASAATTALLVVRQAPVLGPNPALLTALERRIHEAGIPPRDPRWGLVVAAAGSTDPDAQASVTAAAAQLHRRGWSAAVAGFAASAKPTVSEAVALLRTTGVSRVAIASYLLAPGRFSDALRTSGADVVSAPLGDAPEIAGLLIRRYDVAVRALGARRCRRGPRVRPEANSHPPYPMVHL